MCGSITILCSEVIKKAVRKGGFPPDFRRWLWTQLCKEYGMDGKQSSISSAIQTVQEVIHLSDEYFSVLGQGDYKSTISAWEQLSSAATVLEDVYSKDREAKKRREAEEAQKRREAEEAQKRREAEDAQRLAKQRKVAEREMGSSDQVRLFMSYARGPETTRFARKLKSYLESKGFIVWMDEEGIAGK
mgnify:CR=1 FL=1